MGRTLDPSDSINRGLGARYLLNEGAGTAIFDVGPRQLRGSLVNATWAHGPLPALGPFGRLVSFDDTGDRLNFGSGAWSNGVTSMSIAFWIRPASLANYDSLFCRGTWAADWASHTGATGAIWWGYSSSDRVVSGAGTLAVNVWSFIVLSFIDRRWRVYKNGSQIADAAATVAAMPASTRNATFSTYIGANNSDFHGLLAQVIFYSRALTIPEIQRFYREPVAGLFSGQMDLGVGTLESTPEPPSGLSIAVAAHHLNQMRRAS